jgi:hypothetical protein
MRSVIATDPAASVVVYVGLGLSAISSFTAVWVAIVQPRLRQPCLSISTPQRRRELIELKVDRPDSDPPEEAHSGWVRVAVEAKSGRDTAKNVEVTIQALREVRPRPGGSPGDDPMLVGMQLAASYADRASAVDVPSGGYRMFDVATTYEPLADAAPLIIEVAGAARPGDKRNWLLWGVVEIESVTAANARGSKWYCITIEFDGVWEQQILHKLKVVDFRELKQR